MPAPDPRVDAYIAGAPEFARPVLAHLRRVVREACPEAEETIKWGRPHFVYRGRLLCGMWAFTRHCAFGFWRGAHVVGDARADTAMGQFGRIAKVDDLPPAGELAAYVRQAMALAEAGPAAPRRAGARPAPEVPADLAAALAADAAARATFDGLSPAQRRDYVEWLVEAKGEATRRRRMETALAWLAEGKTRNWKYERAR